MVVAIYATMPATVTRHIAIGVVDTTDATDEISENYPHGKTDAKSSTGEKRVAN